MTTNTPLEREELKRKLVGMCPSLQNLSLRYYQDVLADFIIEQKAEAAREAEKAYGGCHSCYGKGYSTEAHAEIAYADFGDELGGDSQHKTERLRMNFCKCPRGKQLEGLLASLNTKEKEKI